MNQELRIGAWAILGVAAVAGLAGKLISRRKVRTPINELEWAIHDAEMLRTINDLQELDDALERSIVNAKFWLLVTEEG